ncbi:curlin [Lentilitoribacter sp. Alg239-R112]|uniref:curlin n=1 Tax=Lentilitoribacter sp. Alg239-R112 TaxID=2305987 RepID=UPI001FCE6DD3|nr:curlin [Lentilitoribacter sp. Alg239-R112]
MTSLTRKSMTSIATGITAITLVSLAVLPAQAGGQIQIDIAAQNSQDANAIKTGLAFYSIVKGIKSQGGITQNGNGNNAGVAQNGSGNQGIVHQHGNGHNGTVQQVGNNNSHGLFQFGKNTDAHANQNGNGNAGATFAFGW